jgi:hypothetical protein
MANTKIREFNVRWAIISHLKISLEKRTRQGYEYTGRINDMPLRWTNPGQRCQSGQPHPCIAKAANPEINFHGVDAPSSFDVPSIQSMTSKARSFVA